jgi:hypothetical protein
VRTKTRRSSGFRNLLWEFNVSEIESKTSRITQDNDIHHLYKEGFNNLRAGFEEFLIENEINYDSNESGYFKIYSNVAVELYMKSKLNHFGGRNGRNRVEMFRPKTPESRNRVEMTSYHMIFNFYI